MHGQEEGDACEVGETMHGRQEGCVETKGEWDAWQTRGMCRNTGRQKGRGCMKNEVGEGCMGKRRKMHGR